MSNQNKADNQAITIIAIDGPSGVGKGTLAWRLANQLGFHILDSGAVYRIAALKWIQLGEDLDLEQQDNLVERLLRPLLEAESDVEFSVDVNCDPVIRVFQMKSGKNIDISGILRTEEIAGIASKLAAMPWLRQVLLAYQRRFAQSPGLVADGRDMGTVVFKQAKYKFFLTASAEIRAKRRYQQLLARGMSANIASLCKSIQQRDERDRVRTHSPLHAANDAHLIDTSNLDIEEVFSQVLGIVTSGNSLNQIDSI